MDGLFNQPSTGITAKQRLCGRSSSSVGSLTAKPRSKAKILQPAFFIFVYSRKRSAEVGVATAKSGGPGTANTTSKGHRHMYLGLVAAMMLLCHGASQTQSGSKPEQKAASHASRCDREQGQKLIVQLVAEAKKLSAPEMPIPVLVIIADRLWTYDEGAARALLQEADDFAALETARRAEKEQVTKDGSAGAIDPLFTIIEAVARHDKVWARRLINTADEQYQRNHPAGRGETFQHQRYSMWQLQQLSLSLLPTDQDAAIDFMRDAFRFPVAGQLPHFLFERASRDQKAADVLYQEAFQTYRSGEITAILGLSAYPFGLNQLVGRPIDLLPRGQQIPAGFAPNPGLQVMFLELLFERAEGDLASLAKGEPGLPSITPPAEPVLIYEALVQLEPAIQRCQPAMTGRAAHLRSALGEALPPNWLREARRLLALADQMNETDFDARIKAAEKQAHPDTRDNNLADIIMAFGEAQPLAKLCAVAFRVTDAGFRRELLDWLYFQSAQKAAAKGRLEELTQLASEVDSPGRRAYLTYAIAKEKLKETGNKTDTLKIITPLVKDVLNAPAIEETSILTLVAASRLYARIGDARAFEAMTSAIETMNRLDLRDPALGSIKWTFSGRRFAGGWVQKLDEANLEDAFRLLAGFDFERAVSMARNIRDRRSQAIALMALALRCFRLALDVVTHPVSPAVCSHRHSRDFKLCQLAAVAHKAGCRRAGNSRLRLVYQS